VITDKSGNVIYRRDFMPFGEELSEGVGTRSTTLKYAASGTDGVRKRFTGYEKDAETDLDFAEARMYQNKHGRFTAVDPLMASASPGDPQTYNRYSYTGNNPINRTDPAGLKWCREDATGNAKFTGEGTAFDKGWTGFDDQERRVSNGGNFNGTYLATGQIAFFNSNGSIELREKPSESDQVERQNQNVVQGQNEVIESSVTELATNITIRPRADLPLPPCVPGTGCQDVSKPSPPSLEVGASADEVLDATQTVTETIGLVPGLEVADLASGAISGFRGDYTGMILSAGAILPVGGQVFTGVKWARRLEKARELGKAGELAAGITEAKKAIEVGGRKLFPDAVDNVAGVLTEVKNLGKQSYTRQLREYSKYARSQPEKMDFVLFTRSDTILSGPLKREISSGNIIHKCFDGPCKQF